MKLEKTKRLAAAVMTACVLIISAACAKQPQIVYDPTPQRNADESSDETVPDNVANLESIIGEDGTADPAAAMYTDYAFCFSELDEMSLLIARGRVLSAGPASGKKLAQKAEIELSEIYKGSAPKRITVYQLYDCEVKEGGEYILFLGSQFPDEPDSNVFFTVGGGQGCIEIIGSDLEGQLTFRLNSKAIYDEDLMNWLNSVIGADSESFRPAFEVGEEADRNAGKYGEYVN